MDSKRFTLPSSILLPIAFSLLRTCWLWPNLEWVRYWLVPSAGGPLLPWPVMVVVFLVAIATALNMPTQEDNLRRSRFVAVTLGFAALALVLWLRFYAGDYHPWDVRWLARLATALTHWHHELPAQWVVLLATAWLWLRGLLDGRQELHTDHVQRALAAGVAGFAVALVLLTVDGHSLPSSTGPLLFIFFAAGMIALAVSSLQLGRGAGLAHSDAQVSINRYWLATVAGVVIALLGLGLALGTLIAPQTLTQVLNRLAAVWRLLGQALGMVVLALAYVAFWLLSPLIAWFQSLPAEGTMREETGALQSIQEQLAELAGERAPAADTPEAMRWLGLGVILVATGLAFALALARLNQRRQEETAEVRETVFSRDLLEAQLSEMWKSWLGRLRRRRPAPRLPFLSLEGEPPTRRAIRALYQALLAIAATRGCPRSRAQTPAEYRDALQATFPQSGKALATITDAYGEARYGLYPPSPSTVERAEQAWQQMQGDLVAREGKVAASDAGSPKRSAICTD